MSMYECPKCGGVPGITACCTDQRKAVNMTEQLKPCPFCNAQPMLYDLLDTHGGFSVECPTVGCDTDKMKRTKAEAIEAWNRRAQPAQRIIELEDKQPQADLLAAAKEFCRKVDAGEARSTTSYAAFKLAIERIEKQPQWHKERSHDRATAKSKDDRSDERLGRRGRKAGACEQCLPQSQHRPVCRAQ